MLFLYEIKSRIRFRSEVGSVDRQRGYRARESRAGREREGWGRRKASRKHENDQGGLSKSLPSPRGKEVTHETLVRHNRQKSVRGGGAILSHYKY